KSARGVTSTGTTASFAASGASNGATTNTTSAIEINTATSRNIELQGSGIGGQGSGKNQPVPVSLTRDSGFLHFLFNRRQDRRITAGGRARRQVRSSAVSSPPAREQNHDGETQDDAHRRQNPDRQVEPAGGRRRQNLHPVAQHEILEN